MRAALREPRRHDQLQQQAAGAEADGEGQAVVPPGEDRSGKRQEKRGRDSIGGDRQAAEQR